MATISAAEKRKQKILERGSERMAKVLGTYGQDLEEEVATPSPKADLLDARSHAEPSQGDSLPSQADDVTAQVRHRLATGKTGGGRTESPAGSGPMPDQNSCTQEEAPEGASDSLLAELERTPAHISFAAAVPVAAWQMGPSRLVCAVLVAAIVTRGWLVRVAISPVLQVVCCSIALIVTAAWQLQRSRDAYRRLREQRAIRRLHTSASPIAAAATALLGKSNVAGLNAVYTILLALYVDSAVYLTAVVVFHLISRDTTRIDHIVKGQV